MLGFEGVNGECYIEDERGQERGRLPHLLIPNGKLTIYTNSLAVFLPNGSHLPWANTFCQ